MWKCAVFLASIFWRGGGGGGMPPHPGADLVGGP